MFIFMTLLCNISTFFLKNHTLISKLANSYQTTYGLIDSTTNLWVHVLLDVTQ